MAAGLLALALAPAGTARGGAAEDAVADPFADCGEVIGRIDFRALDVFDTRDPREDRLLFRLANRLHATTRQGVIEHQLLFAPGDPYDPRLLAESARLLRGNRYLYDAAVRPTSCHAGQVDVEVVTRDVWTLNVGAGVGRAGGKNRSHVLLQDTNLLGTGKSVTLERRSSVDRTTELVRYVDDQVGGSRLRLDASVADHSDGGSRTLSLDRPFYSLDARWAGGVYGRRDDRVDHLYRLGRVSDRFRHRQDIVELRGGRSQGLVGGWARRWSAGFTYRRDRFSAVAADGGDPGTSAVPPERTLAYPWIAFDAVEDGWVTVSDHDQIHRTEDLDLGGRFHALVGVSTPALGGASAAVFAASAARGLAPAEHHTLVARAEVAGRWDRRGAADTVASAALRWYWRDVGDQLFFATLEGTAAERLDPEEQIVLGGEEGLRGYPLRYQSGDRRLLLTLEQRIFTDLYPFRLVHVGGAVFFDVGRTWSAAADPDARGWLRDVGVGLRFAPSRSGLGGMVHLDLAFPLDGDGSIERVQWLVSTKDTF